MLVGSNIRSPSLLLRIGGESLAYALGLCKRAIETPLDPTALGKPRVGVENCSRVCPKFVGWGKIGVRGDLWGRQRKRQSGPRGDVLQRGCFNGRRSIGDAG
jgi:hypothetical protein